MPPHDSASFPLPCATVALLGEIDLATAWCLRQAVLEQPAPVVALDLSGVTFMDAAGVRGLLEARERLEADGRRLVLVAPSDCVRRLLATVGLMDDLRIGAVDRDGATSDRRVVDLRDRDGADEDLAAPPRR